MEHDKTLQVAQSLQLAFENAQIQLVRNVIELNTPSEGSDLEDVESKDPAIVKEDVAEQISYLRKLKFQYLEQNAKDRYIKSIVSDIDDASIVSDEDNRTLQAENAERKERLRLAKSKLGEVQNNIRTLAPLVEDDYIKVKTATDQATALTKKIIDARLALTRLRQTHPQPRLTVQLADKRLEDQVEEMQSLTEEIETVQERVRALKHGEKAGTLEVERLRAQRAETEKNVKAMGLGSEDDGRLVPLYDWYTASLTLHQSLHNLVESHAASDNELRLTYQIDVADSEPQNITLQLIFQPNTHQLAAIQVVGLDEMGVDLGDIADAHVQVNDVHGAVAAILARAGGGRDGSAGPRLFGKAIADIE